MRLNYTIIKNINQDSNLNKILFKMVLKKKLFSIFFFFGILNIVYKKQIQYCVYFFNSYIESLLKLIKYLNIIFNYYVIWSHNIKINKLVIVYFNVNILIKKKQIVKSLSTHARYIYISVKNLNYLVKNNNKILFIINTSKGLILHTEALKLNIGGQLLCSIRK
jgi:ribosomal protein S8